MNRGERLAIVWRADVGRPRPCGRRGKLHLLPLSPPALVLERFFCSETLAERYLVRWPGARENCLSPASDLNNLASFEEVVMPVDVLTNRYNPARMGANLNETILNQSNVNVNGFGKLFTRTVDGQIYAQPLIVTDLAFPVIGPRSAVIVATTRNMVYAFDAEDPEACHPFWAVNLDELGATPVPRSDYGGDYTDFTSEIGITSTPVIDRSAETIFVTAKSKKRDAGGKPHYRYRLHALDLLTGADKHGGPLLVAETVVNDPQNGKNAKDFHFVAGPKVAGTGNGNVDGQITLNAFLQLQRPGLLLQDGALFVAFASHGDIGSYHGWVLAFDAGNLRLLATYCTTPDWGEGGIWQSGCGLAGDGAGNLFAVCGNGSSRIIGDPTDAQLAANPAYGHSVLKLWLDRPPGGSIWSTGSPRKISGTAIETT